MNKQIKSYVGKDNLSCVSFSALAILALTFACEAYSQSGAKSPPSVESAYECTQVSLDDIDESMLTKQERIALLDKSLSASIDSYSTCVSSVVQNMSGGGTGGGGGLDGSGTGNIANQDVGQTGAMSQNDSATSSGQDQNGVISPTGKQLPENISGTPTSAATRGIIPPKDNDKIICKLLFQEISKTQDPDMLESLKAQYSNYQCN
jgi:hypothetical protein